MAPSAKVEQIRKTQSAPANMQQQQIGLIGSYVLAESAKKKLIHEAGRSEHNLHRLLGHAMMLDRLEEKIKDLERR